MKVKSYVPWVYMAPFLILFVVFFCYPFFSGFYYSFTNYDMARRNEFIGLYNYQQMFDPASPYFKSFWISVKNTFVFMILSIPLLIAIPFILANLIVSLKEGHKFTGFFYISSMFSISSAMLIWFSMLSSRGIINFVLNSLFGIKIAWTTNLYPAWASILGSTVWWTIGLNLVIFIAGISAIPKELFESASLEGANAIKKIISITIPSVKYQLTYTAVTTMIASSNVFGQSDMLTRGGPGEATNTVTRYIRSVAFTSAIPQGGLGSAMGITFGMLIILITVVCMVIINRGERD